MEATNDIRLLLALLAPLVGAGLVMATGKKPNLRETVSLVAAVTLFSLVASLVPAVRGGTTGRAEPGRPPTATTRPHASAPWRVARLMGQPSATVRVTPAFWAASWTARTISSTPGLVRLTTSVRRRMAMNDD